MPPPLAAPVATPPAERRCLNCETRVDDAFCPHCGQEYEGAAALSTRLTFHDLIDDAVQVNRSFFHTMRVLVAQPGELTTAYLAGRRARYVSPSKLYLVVNFAYFLVVQWFDPITADIAAEIAGKGEVVAAAQQQGLSMAEFAEGVEERIADVFPTWLFLLVPLFAGVLKLLYLRSGRTFAAHTVFSFHYIAFVLVAATPVSLLPAAWTDVTAYAWLFGALPLWLLFALRRVYGQGWAKTAGKTLAAWVVIVTLIMLYYTNVVNWAVAAG